MGGTPHDRLPPRVCDAGRDGHLVRHSVVAGMVTAQIIALAKAGTPYDVMAAETGLSRGTVAMAVYRARKNGEDIPYFRKPRGKRNGRLSADVVASILVRARRGDKVQAIADRWGLPRSTVAGRMAQFREAGLLTYRNNVSGR